MRLFSGKVKKYSLLKYILGVLFLIFLLAISYAGIRQDLLGNVIKNDVVTPAGGGRIVNGSGNVINASIGQCAVGFSQAPSGHKLYHGVHSPVLLPTQVQAWQSFEK